MPLFYFFSPWKKGTTEKKNKFPNCPGENNTYNLRAGKDWNDSLSLSLSCSHFYLLLSCWLLALVNIPGLKMYSCCWRQFSEGFFQLCTNFSSWTNIAFSPCQNTSASQALFVWVADLIGGKTMICCLWFSFFQGM